MTLWLTPFYEIKFDTKGKICYNVARMRSNPFHANMTTF